MAEQRSRRGFTRIDALVVGTTCLLLVPLVPVALAMTREHHFRTVCAANLAQIGKTMFVYANDYEDILPRAGGNWAQWGPTANWMAPDRNLAFGVTAEGYGGCATITSNFYLLVKYYQMPTSIFLCAGDKGVVEFQLSDVSASLPAGFALTDAWDFGPQDESRRHSSFSYHYPFNQYALMTSYDPNLAVAADRIPWITNLAGEQANFIEFRPDIPGDPSATPESARAGNSFAHEREGQNVLFLDGRVVFETRSYCGVNRDNIYTLADPTRDSLTGIAPPSVSVASPFTRTDSVLLHDPNAWVSTSKPHR